MAVIGGIIGQGAQQTFSENDPLTSLTIFGETTLLFDGLVPNLMRGSLSLETKNLFPFYDIEVTLQIIFPQSNSRLELSIFKDGVQVDQGITMVQNGNIFFSSTVSEDFTVIEIRGRNAADGSFGSQRLITPLFQFAKLFIAGRPG